MSDYKWVAAGALAAGLLVGVRAAQQPADRIDVQALGPQVGAAVPSFSLPDQHGVVQTLQSLMGPRGLMLVFSRSADW